MIHLILTAPSYMPPREPFGYETLAVSSSLWGHIRVVQNKNNRHEYKCLFNSMEHSFEYLLSSAATLMLEDVIESFSVCCKRAALEQAALDAKIGRNASC